MSESIPAQPAEVEVPALENEPGPSQVAVKEHKREDGRPKKQPFYFDDAQVVLQVGHTITAFPLTLFNLPFSYRWADRRTKYIVIF
jgi:hypothetical protein